jgi:hypothetical protein
MHSNLSAVKDIFSAADHAYIAQGLLAPSEPAPALMRAFVRHDNKLIASNLK